MKAPAPKRSALTEEENEKLLDRLYTLSTKASTKRRTEFNDFLEAQYKKQHPKPPRGELSEREVKAVQTLYQTSIERKAHTMKKLEDKFVPKPAAAKQLQAEEIDTMAQRLHSSHKAHHDQMIAKLADKIYGRQGEGQRKLSKAEMEESVKRQYEGILSKKKENYEKLEEKYLFHPPKKQIAAEDIQAMADRLSTREQK